MTDKVQKIREEVESYKSAAEHFLQYKDNLEQWCIQKDLCDKFLSFIDSLQKEPVSEELEEAAFDNAQKNYKEGFRGAAMQAFNEGAKWQKEQMMKSVLASQEMTCIQVAHRLIGGSWNLACPTDKIGLKSNDKVKVIIIKDE